MLVLGAVAAYPVLATERAREWLAPVALASLAGLAAALAARWQSVLPWPIAATTTAATAKAATGNRPRLSSGASSDGYTATTPTTTAPSTAVSVRCVRSA